MIQGMGQIPSKCSAFLKVGWKQVGQAWYNFPFSTHLLLFHNSGWHPVHLLTQVHEDNALFSIPRFHCCSRAFYSMRMLFCWTFIVVIFPLVLQTCWHFSFVKLVAYSGVPFEHRRQKSSEALADHLKMESKLFPQNTLFFEECVTVNDTDAAILCYFVTNIPCTSD